MGIRASDELAKKLTLLFGEEVASRHFSLVDKVKKTKKDLTSSYQILSPLSTCTNTHRNPNPS